MRASAFLAFLSISLALAAPARADRPASLDDLLKRVKTGWQTESQELKQVEARFRAAKDKQRQLLSEAKAALAAEQRRGEALEKEFDLNKTKVGQLEEALKRRLGTMGELLGVIRQVAGDTISHVDGSLTTAQFPGRTKPLEPLARSKALPTIKQLQQMWYVLQHEMTESGKVVRFTAPVITVEGDQKPRSVIRIGVFNAIADGRYLHWDAEVSRLAELRRQPASRYLATAAALGAAKQGFERVAVDPSRGQVLSMLVQTPSLTERIQLGGLVGYIIIGIGIGALLLGLFRFVVLFVVDLRVRRQRAVAKASGKNPLGRILRIYETNPEVETETMELKLDEAIMRESSRLERFLWVIKIGAVVAPLLGLLGTVTGMIRTFQAITLFGTGDPKLMAGGISEALVTTMLGLCVAIPLVLLHSWLRSMSKKVVGVLEEQSAGIVARRAEQALQHG
jgi:biopolymer transport protein ExbB